MPELYPDHLANENGLKHERFVDLKGWKYRPEYLEHKVVPSSSEDHAYLVSKIEVLNKPVQEADIVADSMEVILCSCDSFYFNESAGVENGDRKPSEMRKCKHGISAYRTEKAKNDEKQETIA